MEARWFMGVKSKFLDTSALVWLLKSLNVSFDRVAGCGALGGRQRRNLFLQILSRSRANCSRTNPRSASSRHLWPLARALVVPTGVRDCRDAATGPIHRIARRSEQYLWR